MVNVAVEKKVLELLNSFIDGSLTDPLSALNEFDEDDFSFNIKFKKYKSCLNAPAAQVIIDFQNSIYRIAALSLKGTPDVRRLSKEEKERLEIPFKISESSTIEEAQKVLKTIKELLKMIPEKQRALCLIAIMGILFSYLGWAKYIDSLDKAQQSNVLESAITKMGEQNIALTNIIKNQEKQTLTQLSKIDKEIEINNNVYSSEQLQNIKKKKYPAINNKEISSIKGIYTIIDINLKDNYLIVEEDASANPLKIHYNANDLLAQMNDIKKHLHTAIDDEGKRFYIEATIIKKNNKIDTRVLSIISENTEDQ